MIVDDDVVELFQELDEDDAEEGHEGSANQKPDEKKSEFGAVTLNRNALKQRGSDAIEMS